MVKKAKRLATTAHEGQLDAAGVAYIEHPRFVADLVEGDDKKAVAWLHDIIEDTNITAELLSADFPAHIVDAVVALTKIKGENYEDYLCRVKGNAIARAVKLADLSHNMLLDRLPAPTEKDYKRLEKYKHAYKVLNEEVDKT